MNFYEINSSARNYDVTSSVSNEQTLKVGGDPKPYQNEGFLSPNPFKKTQGTHQTKNNVNES